MRKTFALAATALAVAFATPAVAQDLSYTPGSVWDFRNIKVEPGQFDAYLDYLAGTWKKIQEFGKKQDYVVSYHVFSNNMARKDEPDLILAIEYKDYTPNAQLEVNRKKLEAFMQTTSRAMETGSAERTKLRTQIGGMELQELKLK